jgi:3',5'-cyclic AMP phosphodiesterase CpdA
MRTIAHISDIHFGKVNPVVAEGLVADLSKRTPSLLVMSGDFTQRARASQFAEAAAFMKRLPGPQLVVPGNHDISLHDVFRRFFRTFSRYGKYITTDLRPTYRDEEMIVLGMNTARPFSWTWNGFWKDGRLSQEQLLDLKLRTERLPPNVMRIVVTHHPFIPPPEARSHGIVLGAGRALDMMQQCGIHMLLAGHLHMNYSGDVRTHHEAVTRSILSIQAGTAISSRLRAEPNAYNWITIDRNKVSIEVRSWNGTAFDVRTIRHFHERAGVWHADEPATIAAVEA